MREYKRHKFKKLRKYPTIRSIPIRNPQEVRWPVDVGRPRPHSGPTDECFEGDAIWYAIKNNQMVRVTGEPETKPMYVVLDRRKNDMELRLYSFGKECFFVQLYYCIGKEFVSVNYRESERAKRAFKNGDIRWRLSRPLRGEN